MPKTRAPPTRQRTQPPRQQTPRSPPPNQQRQTSLVESTAADPRMNAMMQQIQQQMMMLAAANNGAAEAMRQPAVVAPEPGVDADPWTSVVNGMKDDAREIIDEWRLKGLLPRGTVNVIGQVAYNKVAKHIQSRHPQVPLRVVKTYVTNRLSYFEKTTWMVPVAGNTRPPLNSRTSFTSGTTVQRPGIGYRVYGDRDWPTNEETQACLAVAKAIADSKPLTEGAHFEIFTALGNARSCAGKKTRRDVVDIFATAQADVGRIGDDYATGKATKSGISNLAIARAIVAVFGPGKSLNEKPMVLPSDVYELYIEIHKAYLMHANEKHVYPEKLTARKLAGLNLEPAETEEPFSDGKTEEEAGKAGEGSDDEEDGGTEEDAGDEEVAAEGDDAAAAAAGGGEGEVVEEEEDDKTASEDDDDTEKPMPDGRGRFQEGGEGGGFQRTSSLSEEEEK
ncbi:hypothetical protein CYMTET_4933 [Cymbomonas tetramitiformis]|uniref:Uncharacterized protein n=1 Tax=Cymbomonas tetramitiformis TaxID=36881 RepID=A0AAE0H0E4_9CHLO|nr:hypothetical protein CYMTET_4933 [Cymbomonas tetramitiformis]